MELIKIEIAGAAPTKASEKFDPRNNLVRYSRANYTATADEVNGFAAFAAEVAESIDRVTNPAQR